MNKKRFRLLLCLALVVCPGPLAAQPDDAPAELTTAAEIRINLPAGVVPVVSIAPGTSRIQLDLPREAVFPVDFVSASGGLIGAGDVTPLGEDRLRLDLELAQGRLDRIVYDSDGIVLRLGSRLSSARGGLDSEEIYLLGPADRIRITVHNQPDLDAAVTVSQEGTITVPLVGEVEAAGLGPSQLAARLTELLGRFLVSPKVDVEVDQFRSQWVMIGGEVRVPGRIALRGGTRLKEILSDAEGFGEQAGEEITISRRQGETGEPVVLRVDRSDFEKGINDPILKHGDIIDVGRAKYCYLQGEVRDPHRVRIERDMTLLRAISLVGGLTDWADRKAVKILRGRGPDTELEVVNMAKIQRGKAEDPVLKGGEIIVVQRRFF